VRFTATVAATEASASRLLDSILMVLGVSVFPLCLHRSHFWFYFILFHFCIIFYIVLRSSPRCVGGADWRL